MRSQGMFSVVALFVSLTGCASYALEPLTPGHPAHPGAAAATRQDLSQTLAYAATNLPVLGTGRSSATVSGEHDAQHGASGSAEKRVTGEGKVIAVVPSASQLVVEHGEIKGFMDAMTMGYRTEPASLLDGLKAGVKVRFWIDVEKKTIVKIEKMD